MKKYFYFRVQFQTKGSLNVVQTKAGVCESSKTGLFPLFKVLDEVSRELGKSLDIESLHVTNTVEISEEDYLMFTYDEIHGNDFEK